MTDNNSNIERHLRSIKAATWTIAGILITGVVIGFIAWASTTIPN